MSTRGGDRGQAAVMIMGALLMVLAFVGLAVDGALMFTARRYLQNVADSAALSGASALDEGAYRASTGLDVRLDPAAARRAVDRVLAASALPGGTVADVDVAPDRVTVRLRRPVSTTFLRIVGLREQRIGATASASPQTG